MKMNTTICAKVDKDTKIKAAHVLHSLRMNLSQAINIFLQQVVYTNSIPFELKVPTKALADTITKVDSEQGLHEVSNAEELLKELNK
jgi:DNA-damage-inducible protein J